MSTNKLNMDKLRKSFDSSDGAFKNNANDEINKADAQIHRVDASG